MADPYVALVPLRWSDMDAYRHVNNVQYLRLLEDARVTGFRDWAGDGPSMLEVGVVVTRHVIEYRAPLVYRPEPVCVELWVTRIQGAGFDVGYVVRDPDDVGDAVYAVAETGLALYDFASERPRRIEPDMRAILQDHLGDPVPLRWSRR